MKITLTSIFIDDQEKALKFYIEMLGFEKKLDIPMSEARWLPLPICASASVSFSVSASASVSM